jgi:hypothetical protein
VAGSCEHGKSRRVHETWEFLEWLSDFSLLKKDLAHWSLVIYTCISHLIFLFASYTTFVRTPYITGADNVGRDATKTRFTREHF